MKILYKHNAEAYEKVKKSMETNDRTCIVHATGTGKSFIALQLMIDFLEANPNKHIYYITPLNGIKRQIIEHVEKLQLPEEVKMMLNNVEFVTYQALTTKSRNELNNLDVDLLIIDEFHHLGAREWTAAINQIVSTHPEIKIFGMSATSVRERGTANEQDVSETFFDGNVASTYDLSDAIADNVLPAPNYHAALTFLEDECAELEEKINSGKASNEEKEQYNKIIRKIKQQIAMMEVDSTADIIRKYIKPNGKYIYFCPKINYDTDDTIESVQENLLKELPEELRGNVEFYQVHSSNYTQSQNNSNHYNFYHNITSDGKDAHGKLRIMFAIDMYNEGIHVPDIDGVIMGRNTQSEIIFYQQLGRALAVKKSDDNSEDISSAPLIIDLMDNFRQILKLYKKMKSSKKLKEEMSEQEEDILSENSITKSDFTDSIPINFGIDEEIINVIEELDTVKEQLKLLSFEEKLEEVYNYLLKHNELPLMNNNVIKFSDGSTMSSWLSFHKIKLIEMQKTDERASTIIQELDRRKGLSFEERLKEVYAYLLEHGSLPKQIDEKTAFSDGVVIGPWLGRYKNKLIEIQETDERARAIIKQLNEQNGLSFEEKLEEAYTYLLEHGDLPKRKDKKTKFSDGVVIGPWLSRYKNKLIEMQDTDEWARAIIQELIRRKRLSFEERLKEVYTYLLEHGDLPKLNEKTAKFSDDILIISWLSRFENKLIEIQETDERARAIIKHLNEQKRLSFEEKLEEAYTYLLEHGDLPKQKDKKAKFSDGVFIGVWLSRYKNKLIEMQDTDERARAIIKHLNEQKRLSFEEKLEEAYTYLLEHGDLPNQRDKTAKFSDSSRIGNWLFITARRKLNKMQETDERTRAIIKQLNKQNGLSFEERLKEVYTYLLEHGDLPKSKDKTVKFSDERPVITWLYNNKIKLIENYSSNQNIKKLVDLILEIKPNFFDNVLRTLKAKEEFGTVSKFEEVKQRIIEAKMKGKEDEGRKIQ